MLFEQSLYISTTVHLWRAKVRACQRYMRGNVISIEYLLCLVKLKSCSLFGLLLGELRPLYTRRAWSGMSRAAMMACIRNKFPLLEWNQLFIEFAWSMGNEMSAGRRSRGKERALWIVLIHCCLVYQDWFLTLRETLDQFSTFTNIYKEVNELNMIYMRRTRCRGNIILETF